MLPTTPWLTEEEAAAYLGFDHSSLRNLRYAGKGPQCYYHRGGRGVVYCIEDLDTWMKQYAFVPGDPRPCF